MPTSLKRFLITLCPFAGVIRYKLVLALPIHTDDKGVETVNARELHTFLGSKRDFSTWIKNRIEKFDFIADLDFTTILGESSGGRPGIEYHISTDMAKELCMVEGTPNSVIFYK